jgi:cystathionine beta-lyase family protein involved in aluminum resistance
MVNLLKHWSLQRWYVHDCHHLMGMVFISLHTLWQGADLIAGSLIKSPGGTIAPCGGYVAGKKDLVEAAAARLSAPGLGVEFGSTPGHVMRALFQGLFLAPQMVGEAVKVGYSLLAHC